MLAIEALTKRFGGVVAVDSVSFGVNAGEVVGLIGPNGAGKTTVLNLITGFSRPSAGKVLFNGKEVTGTPPYALAKLGIVRTFQTTSLFSRMTVLENVRIGTHLRAGRRKCQAIGVILEEMNLAKFRDFAANSLPYGVQRRLEIAVALAADPKLLLLDEPAAGMNPEETYRLIEELKLIIKKNITIILVEHNMRFVAQVCQRIVVLHRGRKIAEGVPGEVLELPQVIEIYLGKRRYA
jgi:branched-chain amino acid transport system ATP-binding protein